MITRVCTGTSKVMPSGASTITGMAEAEGHAQLVGRNGLGAIADADDLELLAEAVGDTDDHVVDQRAGEAVQRPALALVVGTLDHDHLARRGGP